jgi:hypothetical protein
VSLCRSKPYIYVHSRPLSQFYSGVFVCLNESKVGAILPGVETGDAAAAGAAAGAFSGGMGGLGRRLGRGRR